MVVVVVVVVGGVAAYFSLRQAGTIGAEYSAVYLTSGDIYIGRLATFPTMALRDGYFFRMVSNTDPKLGPNFELTPMKEFVWGPKVLNINRDQVLLTAPLSEESRVVKAIRESQP